MSSSEDGTNCIEGILHQNVVFGFWSKRFCRLINNQFMIFKKRTDKKPQQTVYMSTLVQIEIVDATNNKFRIKIPTSSKLNENFQNPIQISTSIPNLSQLASDDVTYNYIYLQASSKNEMMKWILDLRVCSYANPEMSMDMFKIISVIGRGQFGKVMLCQKKDTQEIVAVKSVHKSRLVEAKKLYTILAERNILANVKHPFIISLKYAFQTPTKFYLGLEYAPGGDLFHLISDSQPPLDDIKLYIAEISLALEELHKNGVIYRDLKPENVLFDSKGHIKLTDFGLSKLFDSSPANCSNQIAQIDDKEDCTFNLQTTSTFCGTTEYIAPEMIKKTGYSYSVDWWSLGVLAYELFFQSTPFESASKKQTYSNILKADPYYPPNCNPDIKEFLQMLLQKSPKKRGNFESIKSSKFFQNFNFDAVLRKEIPPLHVPVVYDLTNPNNFDKQFTNEAPMDSVVYYDGNTPMVSNFSFSCLTSESGELLPTTLNHSLSIP